MHKVKRIAHASASDNPLSAFHRSRSGQLRRAGTLPSAPDRPGQLRRAGTLPSALDRPEHVPVEQIEEISQPSQRDYPQPSDDTLDLESTNNKESHRFRYIARAWNYISKLLRDGEEGGLHVMAPFIRHTAPGNATDGKRYEDREIVAKQQNLLSSKLASVSLLMLSAAPTVHALRCYKAIAGRNFEYPRMVYTLDRSPQGWAVTDQKQIDKITPTESFSTLTKTQRTRWIHLQDPQTTFHDFKNFILSCLGLTHEEQVIIEKILEDFEIDQARVSAHGEYFEPAFITTELTEFDQMFPRFLALPYLAFGKQGTANAQSSLVHSLFEYYYRRQPPNLTWKKDIDQVTYKVTRPTASLIQVNSVWVLQLDEWTIVTAAALPVENLWRTRASGKRRIEDHLWIEASADESCLSPLNISPGDSKEVVKLKKICRFFEGKRHSKLWVKAKESANFSSGVMRELVDEFHAAARYYIYTWQEAVAESVDENPDGKASELYKSRLLSIAKILEERAKEIDITALQRLKDTGTPKDLPSLTPDSGEELLGYIIESAIQQDYDEDMQIEEIYIGCITNLQLEAQSRPTRVLLKDITQVVEELEILMGVVKSQQLVLQELELKLENWELSFLASRPSRDKELRGTVQKSIRRLEIFRNELQSYNDLCIRLSRLTAQQVELQMEYHGKAILVFTCVTIIFLPLSFVTSFFGMNVMDIRNMAAGEWIFWAVASGLTVFVVLVTFVAAFYGEMILKRYLQNGREEGRSLFLHS